MGGREGGIVKMRHSVCVCVRYLLVVGQTVAAPYPLEELWKRKKRIFSKVELQSNTTLSNTNNTTCTVTCFYKECYIGWL